MRVALTDEQELVASTVADMVVRAGVPSPRAGDSIAPDAALWAALWRSGFVGMRAGSERVSAVEVALVAEQLARGPAPVPYLGTLLALELLGAAGAAGVVEQVIDGEVGAAVVVDEPLSALAATGLAWDSTPGAVAVGLDGDEVLVGVDGGGDGAVVDGIDLTRRLERVDALSTRVGSLSPERRTRWEAYALALLAADLVGAMSASLDEVVEHAKSRVQFGRPVGSFQAVQHLCADALVLVESSRSVMWHAAWAVDALDADAGLSAARVAKAYCAESARDVCEAAIQVWGGIGMTWECRAHLFLRRALLTRRTLGDESVQLAHLADERLAAVPAGEAR